MNYKRPAEHPPPRVGARVEQRKQCRDLRRYGWNRQAVADGDLNISIGRAAFLYFDPRGVVKVPAEIRAQQVFLFPARVRVNFEQLPTLDEFGAEACLQIELRADRVLCGSMSLAQVQLRVRGVGGSGPTDEQTRGRARTNPAHDFRNPARGQRPVGFVWHSEDLPKRRLKALHQLAPRRRVQQSGFRITVNSLFVQPTQELRRR